MTMTTTHGDETRTRGNKYNLTPETARVGVQIGQVIIGALQYDDTDDRISGK